MKPKKNVSMRVAVWGITTLLFTGCPAENDSGEGEDADMPTCGDLLSAAELDDLIGGVSGWDESASPVCAFSPENSSGAGVQVVLGGARDYEALLGGAREQLGDGVEETNTVGARSFVYQGDVYGVETAEVGFLDTTERYAVLVFINDYYDNQDIVEEVAMAVDENLEVF